MAKSNRHEEKLPTHWQQLLSPGQESAVFEPDSRFNIMYSSIAREIEIALRKHKQCSMSSKIQENAIKGGNVFNINKSMNYELHCRDYFFGHFVHLLL